MFGSGFLPGPSRPVEATVMRGLTLTSWSQTAWQERRTRPGRSRPRRTSRSACAAPLGAAGRAAGAGRVAGEADLAEKVAALEDVELGLRHPVGLAFQVLDPAGGALRVGAAAVASVASVLKHENPA